MHPSLIRGIRPRLREWWASSQRRGAFRRQIRQALAEGREPVVVFTMAKSASTSVEVSLMQLPELAVFKTHRLDPARIRAYYRERRRLGERESFREGDDLGLAIHDEIIRRGVPARIVVLVREPIARNLSAYFHILPVLWGRRDAFARLTPAEMAAGFLPKGRHRVPLDWFDEEFRPVLGVDVFQTPFPHEQGWVRLQAGPHDVLVLRADLDDQRKAACLAGWLGRDGFGIVRMNEAEAKHYAEAYAAARAELRLPDAYVDEMLDSRYARHFFTPVEIAQLRVRWSGAAPVGAVPASSSAAPGAGA